VPVWSLLLLCRAAQRRPARRSSQSRPATANTPRLATRVFQSTARLFPEMKGFALCVAATLATLAIGSPDITAGGNLRALDDGISADITILAATGIVFGTPTFFYGGSGCGRGNKKCWCTLENNSIQMYGVGSSLTTTGLTFACGFLVNEFTFCELNLDMPYDHHNSGINSATWSCSEPFGVSDFTMVGNDVPPKNVRIEQSMGIYKTTKRPTTGNPSRSPTTSRPTTGNPTRKPTPNARAM
jgi:hypothetical protein